MTIEHKSLLPPQRVTKIDRLPSAERREFVQTLLGRYEYRLRHLDKAARELATTWAASQRIHFENVVIELNARLEER